MNPFAWVAAIGVVLVALFSKEESDSRDDAAPFRYPDKAKPYLDAINAAEREYGLRPGLLASLIYAESRFRPDIIDGTVRSSKGAIGIAQIIPRFHPDVDPLDPFASIDYAARYLAEQIRAFGGDEAKGLAAYNWGPTNVRRKGLARAPKETRDYIADIQSRLA